MKRAPYRRKPDWMRRGAVTTPPAPQDDVIPVGHMPMGIRTRRAATDREVKSMAAAVCNKVDDLPRAVRLGYKACMFEVDVAAAFRFGKHAQRNGLTDDQVMKVFANIQSARDVIKFNTLWGSS